MAEVFAGFTDFHSHILPGIDDGSKDVSMSLKMIRALQKQGVDTICATSHFYATQRSVSHFLERREEAWEMLEAELPDSAPEILLGAEVLYFPGISRMKELPELCLEGTDILLLEMPFHPWSDYYIREVKELANSRRFTILMAHIERYYFLQPVSVWDDFLDLDIIMQSNAEFFLPFKTRRKALKLLKEERIHVLGTDTHNMTSRPPRMDEAREIIRKHLGQETLDEIDAFGDSLLGYDH